MGQGRSASLQNPDDGVQREARRDRLAYWIMLGSTVLTPALAAVLLDSTIQVFPLTAEALLGFVGAYWLTLQDLIRRNVPDLETSAYGSVNDVVAAATRHGPDRLQRDTA